MPFVIRNKLSPREIVHAKRNLSKSSTFQGETELLRPITKLG
jgi:hypothetical protein